MKKFLFAALVLVGANNALAWNCPVANNQLTNGALAAWVGILSLPRVVEMAKDLYSGNGDVDMQEAATNLAGTIAASGLLYKAVSPFCKK